MRSSSYLRVFEGNISIREHLWIFPVPLQFEELKHHLVSGEPGFSRHKTYPARREASLRFTQGRTDLFESKADFVVNVTMLAQMANPLRATSRRFFHVLNLHALQLRPADFPFVLSRVISPNGANVIAYHFFTSSGLQPHLHQ